MSTITHRDKNLRGTVLMIIGGIVYSASVLYSIGSGLYTLLGALLGSSAISYPDYIATPLINNIQALCLQAIYLAFGIAMIKLSRNSKPAHFIAGFTGGMAIFSITVLISQLLQKAISTGDVTYPLLSYPQNDYLVIALSFITVFSLFSIFIGALLNRDNSRDSVTHLKKSAFGTFILIIGGLVFCVFYAHEAYSYYTSLTYLLTTASYSMPQENIPMVLTGSFQGVLVNSLNCCLGIAAIVLCRHGKTAVFFAGFTGCFGLYIFEAFLTILSYNIFGNGGLSLAYYAIPAVSIIVVFSGALLNKRVPVNEPGDSSNER